MKFTERFQNLIIFFSPVILVGIFCLQTNRPLIRKFGIEEYSFVNSFIVFFSLSIVSLFITYLSYLLLNKKQSSTLFAIVVLWLSLYYSYFIKLLKAIYIGAAFQKIFIIAICFIVYLGLRYIKKDIILFSKFIFYFLVFFLFTESVLFAKELANKKSISFNFPTLNSNTQQNQEPDIYYFICDAYTSNNSLKEQKFDNSYFKTSLNSLGFYTSENSRSNYPITYPSLASSFNMSYTSLSNNESINYNQKEQLVASITNSILYDFLIKRGYKIFNLSHIIPNGSLPNLSRRDNVYYYWEITKGSVYYTLINKFLDKIPELGTSKLNSQMQYYTYSSLLPSKIDSIVINVNSPKFVYAHFLATHSPFVFNKDLTFNYHSKDNAIISEYIDQVRILNVQLLERCKLILNKNKNAIIIIQADHGSHLLSVDETFTIQNNYYFPNFNYNKLPKNISPVNTFRVVLNSYFKQDLPLLNNVSKSVNY